MISYVTVGTDDIAGAKRFYDAFLPALGYGLHEGPEGLSYALPVAADAQPVYAEFYVKPTFNGAPATAGNGAMVAFEAHDQAQVRSLHAAALDAGGTDEGAPGFRRSKPISPKSRRRIPLRSTGRSLRSRGVRKSTT